MNQPTTRRRIRLAAILLGIPILLLVGVALLAYSIPRYRWRAQVVRLKLQGDLPNITWKELRHLHRQGDPFNLKGLVSDHNPYLVITNPYDSPDGIAAGGKLFQSNCSFCHGSDGAGGRAGPVLKQRQMVRGSDAWALFKTVSNGIPGTDMPASPLPEDDRWRLAAYVKSLADGALAKADSPHHVAPRADCACPV